jgi:hypothetical protein
VTVIAAVKDFIFSIVENEYTSVKVPLTAVSTPPLVGIGITTGIDCPVDADGPVVVAGPSEDDGVGSCSEEFCGRPCTEDEDSPKDVSAGNSPEC